MDQAAANIITCSFCHRPKHDASECWVNPASRNFTVDKLRPLAQVGQPARTDLSAVAVCSWCERVGHLQHQCVFNPACSAFDVEELKMLARTRLPKDKVFCSLCHRPAHTVSECYFNPKSPNYDPTQKNPRTGPRKFKPKRDRKNSRAGSAAQDAPKFTGSGGGIGGTRYANGDTYSGY